MSNARPAAVLPLKVVNFHAEQSVPGTAAAGGRRDRAEHRTTSRPPGHADRSERTHVREELERVVASGDFDASRRSREFLRFIVAETLAGRGADLTQAVIATRVFGRREDFDALVDPIVRIQAGRLRRSLERYYLLSGVGDPLRIELPRGTYVPAFRSMADKEPARVDRTEDPLASPTRFADWPAVAVGPFEPAAPGPGPQEAAACLTESLALELGRYPDVQAFLQSELEQHEPGRRPHPRFSIGGRLREKDGGLRVTAGLVDHATGAQVWGEEYQTAARPGRWSAPLDDIGRVIAARVGAEEGVVVQLLAGERRKRMLAPITPYRAILHSYDFFLARDPNSFSAALHALRQVVDEQPECGLAWSRLAHLCLANHAFEVTSLSTPVDQAITYAQHGVRVDPSSRGARAGLASALLVKGELTAARHELEEALRLSPDSLVCLEAIGALLTLVGDSAWSRPRPDGPGAQSPLSAPRLVRPLVRSSATRRARGRPRGSPRVPGPELLLACRHARLLPRPSGSPGGGGIGGGRDPSRQARLRGPRPDPYRPLHQAARGREPGRGRPGRGGTEARVTSPKSSTKSPLPAPAG